MRTILFMLALSAVACTSQSIKPVQTTATPVAAPVATPAPVATQYISPTGQKLAEISTTGNSTADAKRISDAKKAGYKLVNTNGEELFCRTEPKIGSRTQKETTCLTAKQLDDMHDQTRQGMAQRINNPPPSLSGK
jgi:hypothetical protein